MSILSRCIGSIAGFCLLAGMAFAQENSGFLGDAYSKLEQIDLASGHKAKRWIAPDARLGAFEKLLLEKTTLYPEPQSSDQVSAATLHETSAYLDAALRRELNGIVPLAAEPGPRTLRFRPAITAAAAKDLGLKPYQLLPIAFVLTAGKTSKGASLAVEYLLQDTDTNQIVGAGLREGTGLELKSGTEKLTLEHFKPLLDAWAKDLRAAVEAARSGK